MGRAARGQAARTQGGCRAWARRSSPRCRGRSASAASTRPIRSTFKVWQPDRLVLGKRDGGPPPARRLLLALVRVARASTCSGSGRSTGRGSPPTPTRWTPPGRRWPSRSSSSRSSARRTTASTTATSPPRGGGVRRVPRQPRRPRRRRRGLPGADRRPAPVGHRQPVHAPALPGRRRDQPRPRGVRLRRGAGQAHARGHQAARRRELRPVGRPRGLRHAAQHRPRGARARSSPGSCTSSSSTSTRSASRASS